MSKRLARVPATPLALAAVCLLGAWLRFDNITTHGLVYWDEAKFALEGVRLEALTRALVGLPAQTMAGKAVGTAKPSHALLISLSYALLGIHDYAPLCLDAAFSTFSLPLAFIAGRRLFDSRSALFGTLLLAVSEYDAIYARSALSESDANFFLLLGVALWAYTQPSGINAGRRTFVQLCAAGATLGFGFTVNYRLIVYIAALLLVDAGLTLRRQGVAAGLRRALPWGVGLLLFPLLWQVAGLFAQHGGYELFRGELVPAEHSYLSEVLYQLHGGKQSVLHVSPLPYIKWWVVRQGIIPSLLLAPAVLLALWRRQAGQLACTALVFIPYVVYVFAPFFVPRNLVAAVPFACLLIGALFARAMRAISQLELPLFLALLAVAANGAWLTTRILPERSGMAAAAAWIRAHAAGRALTSSEVPVFYLRGSGARCDAPAFPLTLTALAAQERAGYRYAVVDWHGHKAVGRFIEQGQRPLATWSSTGDIHPGESLVNSEDSYTPDQSGREQYVSIYRLPVLDFPGLNPGRALPCYRDQVT